MPVNSDKIMQTIRHRARVGNGVSGVNGVSENINETELLEPLIQMEVSEEISSEPLIESAGETYERPIAVCFAGVGTHGVNVVMSLKNQNSKNELVDFVGINSDGSSIKELEKYGFSDNIWLSSGDSNTHLGAGGKLEVGKELGDKYYDQFRKRFKNKDLVLIVTGMGGGTGTGAAPLVAKAAREVQQGRNNTLTIGIASMPPGEEYDKREIAVLGIEEFKKHVDALVVIDQLNLLDVLDQENASVEQGEELVDSRFQIVLQSIMDTVTQYTKRNIDFADVCSTFKNCGDAIITTVEAPSENVDSIKKELAKALNDKLLIDHSNKIASRLTVYHFFEREYSIKNHGEVVREVKRLFNWTKTADGFYRCVLENPTDSNFEKVGTGIGDEYKGRTKVIVMAGGFVDVAPSQKLEQTSPRATVAMRVPPPQPSPPPPQQPQPQLQQQQQQPPPPPPQPAPQKETELGEAASILYTPTKKMEIPVAPPPKVSSIEELFKGKFSL